MSSTGSSFATKLDRYTEGGAPEVAVVRPGYPQQALSISAIRAFLWRQKLIVGGAIFAALVAGLVWTLLTKPMYQSSATIRVEAYQAQVVEGQSYTDPYIPTNEVDQYMQTLTEVIKSRQVSTKVVELLGLAKDREALEQLGLADMANLPEQQLTATLASILKSSITVDAPLTNRVMTITVTAPDPALAARIANGYAQAFLQSEVERGVESNAYARDYLEQQIAEVREKLRDSEVSANSYARSNRIINQTASSSDDDAPPATLTASTLISLNSAYTEARENRIAAEQRWRTASATPALSLPLVNQNPSIISLRSEKATVESRLTQLLERYQNDYPEVREARSQVEQIDAQINQVANQIKLSLRDEYQVAQRQENALSAEVSRASSNALDEQDRRVQYGLIDRTAASYRDQLASLLDRYNAVSTAANVRASTATLLDAAAISSTPSSPNLFKNMLVALVLGLALGGGLAFLRELMDDRLRSVDEIERKTGLPSLGQTPITRGDVHDEIEESFSPISEAYSSIRATLDFTARGAKRQVLQITSSQAAEGKSTSALALAEKFAQVGRKVLLVDADMRRPSLLKEIGADLARDNDLVDVLYRRVNLADAIIPIAGGTVSLLPTNRPVGNSIEILSSGLVAEFIEMAGQQYDVIIFDSAPVMGIADAPLLARFVDGVVVVVEANRTSFSQLRATLRRLNDVHANLLGAIVTKYRALEAGDALSYQYSYYSYQSAADR